MNDKIDASLTNSPQINQPNGNLSPEVTQLFENAAEAAKNVKPEIAGDYKTLYVDLDGNKKIDREQEPVIIVNGSNDLTSPNTISMQFGGNSLAASIKLDQKTGQLSTFDYKTLENRPLNQQEITQINEHVAQKKLAEKPVSAFTSANVEPSESDATPADEGRLMPSVLNGMKSIMEGFDQKMLDGMILVQQSAGRPSAIERQSSISGSEPRIISQGTTLSPQSQEVAKSILGRFGINPSPEAMTYDVKPKWSDIPFSERSQISPNNPDMDRMGVVSNNSTTGEVKAFVFSDLLNQRAKDWGVTPQEMQEFTAVQEAGGKELLKKNNLSIQKGELVTEAMSAKVNPNLAYMTVLPYVSSEAQGGGVPSGYRQLVDTSLETTGAILEKNNIGTGSASDRAEMFGNMLASHVEEELGKGNSNMRSIHDTFIAKVAKMSGGRISGEQLNTQLANAYAKGLDDKARP